MIRKERQEKQRRKGRIAASLAAAMLVTALLAQTGYAAPLIVDGDKVQGGTIKVISPTEEAYAALKDDAVFDVYKIASAAPLTGYDAYTFTDFASESGRTYYENNIRDAESPSASVLNGFAQALAADAEAGKIKAGTKDAAIDGEGIPVDAGLYMLILHGVGEAAAWDTADTGELVTYAETESGRFVFAPIVVSVPTRELTWDASADPIEYGSASIVSETAAANTADTTAWTYDITIKAKAGLDDKGIPIQITKNLPVYDSSSEGDFIFEIKATKGDQNTVVYNDVVQIRFTGPGSQTKPVMELDGTPVEIPAGSKVMVKETYAGATYTPDAEEKEAVLNETKDLYTVSFSNKYNETEKSGGSVSNRMNQQVDKNDHGTGIWDLSRVE